MNKKNFYYFLLSLMFNTVSAMDTHSEPEQYTFDNRKKISAETAMHLALYSKEKIKPNIEYYKRESQLHTLIENKLRKICTYNLANIPTKFHEKVVKLKNKIEKTNEIIVSEQNSYEYVSQVNASLFSNYQKICTIITRLSIPQRLAEIKEEGHTLYASIESKLNLLETSSENELFDNFKNILESITENYQKSCKLFKDLKTLTSLLDYSGIESEPISFPLYTFNEQNLKFIPLGLLKFNTQFIQLYEKQIRYLKENNTQDAISFAGIFHEILHNTSQAYFNLLNFSHILGNNLPKYCKKIIPKCAEIIVKSDKKASELKNEFLDMLNKSAHKFPPKGFFYGFIKVIPCSEAPLYSGVQFMSPEPFYAIKKDRYCYSINGVHAVRNFEKRELFSDLKLLNNKCNYLIPTELNFEMDKMSTLKCFNLCDLYKIFKKNYFFIDTKTGLLYVKNSDETVSIVEQINFYYKE